VPQTNLPNRENENEKENEYMGIPRLRSHCVGESRLAAHQALYLWKLPAVRALVPLASVKKEDVVRIEVFESWLCPGIKVWNNSEAFPLFQFWTFRAHRIAQVLELHGYRVQMKEPIQPPQTTTGSSAPDRV